jgi:hypothetical protein
MKKKETAIYKMRTDINKEEEQIHKEYNIKNEIT